MHSVTQMHSNLLVRTRGTWGGGLKCGIGDTAVAVATSKVLGEDEPRALSLRHWRIGRNDNQNAARRGKN